MYVTSSKTLFYQKYHNTNLPCIIVVFVPAVIDIDEENDVAGDSDAEDDDVKNDTGKEMRKILPLFKHFSGIIHHKFQRSIFKITSY